MSTPERDYDMATEDESTRLSDTGTRPATLVEDSGELFERWQRAQAGFVDAPREAVQEAGAIVEDVLGRLGESFGSERSRLEAAWEKGQEPSTEDLRVAIQRYRTFFERLLAA
ncbi:MAG TPA: hypothetical protein VFZ85_19560 [Jiangellaceae bacterium]